MCNGDVSSYVLLRATFGEICCLCGLDWGGVWRAHIPVLPPRDQAELDFYFRQDAAAVQTAPLVQEESLGEGKPSRDCVGEAEPVLCKAACRHGLHSSPLPFSSLSSSPRHCGDPGGVVTSSLFISFSHSLGSRG